MLDWLIGQGPRLLAVLSALLGWELHRLWISRTRREAWQWLCRIIGGQTGGACTDRPPEDRPPEGGKQHAVGNDPAG